VFASQSPSISPTLAPKVAVFTMKITPDANFDKSDYVQALSNYLGVNDNDVKITFTETPDGTLIVEVKILTDDPESITDELNNSEFMNNFESSLVNYDTLKNTKLLSISETEGTLLFFLFIEKI
jgi:hypothetical protein